MAKSEPAETLQLQAILELKTVVEDMQKTLNVRSKAMVHLLVGVNQRDKEIASIGVIYRAQLAEREDKEATGLTKALQLVLASQGVEIEKLKAEIGTLKAEKDTLAHSLEEAHTERKAGAHTEKRKTESEPKLPVPPTHEPTTKTTAPVQRPNMSKFAKSQQRPPYAMVSAGGMHLEQNHRRVSANLVFDPKRATRDVVWSFSGTSIKVVGKERGFWKLEMTDKNGETTMAVSKKRPFEDGVAPTGLPRQERVPKPEQNTGVGGAQPEQKVCEKAANQQQDGGVLMRLERMENVLLAHISPQQQPPQQPPPQQHGRSAREEMLDFLLAPYEPVRQQQSPEAFWRSFAERRKL
jgi:hypothetical protein